MSETSVPFPKGSEEATLRHRKNQFINSEPSNQSDELSEKYDDGHKQDSTWGKTASGVVFRVPRTHSFLTTILKTWSRSSLTQIILLSLFTQPVIFYFLRNWPFIRSTFFLLYFILWRGSYDFGFAYLLRRQSEKKFIVKWLKQRGWLDVRSKSGDEQGRKWAKWWKRELEMKMEDGYKWEEVPPEFNAWLMFRQLVDVVLLNDFVSYSLFAWSNLHFPPNHSVFMHIFRWIFGWGLIFFNLWVKVDAHRVVKDYAWYWGDAFWLMVMKHDLVFDGVYEIAPHPMYSVGYAGYYGLSMVVGSYSVLFVSIAAHAAQFAFLLWFENPHIERVYGGGKKPLASRVPLKWTNESSASVSVASDTAGDSAFSNFYEQVEDTATPGATEGETETEPELPDPPACAHDEGEIRKHRSDSSYSQDSDNSTPKEPVYTAGKNGYTKRAKPISMHDLTHRFFRKPMVTFARMDVQRASDFSLVIIVLYSLSALVPPLPHQLGLNMHFLHALAWRLLHSLGFGYMLRAQSKQKAIVRHFHKHYHYPSDDHEESHKEGVVKRATEEAFRNWQAIYNLSNVMTYVSFAGLAWKTYHLPVDWTVSGTILRHVLGAALIFLHIWAAMSSYEVLGDFGWFYSDFFLIEQIPARLAYTGIYRFLNNPERSMGGAAFFGLWLISNSKLVLTLALISHISHWGFLTFVEKPHMQKLYGDRLRKDGGLTKTLKSVAGKTLASNAGKHATNITRVVRGMSGSFDKVEERVTGAVEEFLDNAGPRFEGIINDTKNFVKQSRERIMITRFASDMSAYNPSDYSLTIATSSQTPEPRFHVGQPIKVSWTAPHNHSRKDWIGIYRLGSCSSQLVTRISSVGKWMPIHEDEYDGDNFVDPPHESAARDAGVVVFKGDQLPWTAGQYELRYHHDGKHNVMSRVGEIDIYVTKPTDDSFGSIHSRLLHIVCLSLDNDPTLIPNVAKSPRATLEFVDKPGTSKEDSQRTSSDEDIDEGDDPDDGRDPDDFTIMEEKQAKRIVSLVKAVFDVDLSVDVVIAEANVASLGRRVIGARHLRASVMPGLAQGTQVK